MQPGTLAGWVEEGSIIYRLLRLLLPENEIPGFRGLVGRRTLPPLLPKALAHFNTGAWALAPVADERWVERGTLRCW